jgi:16S rRNA (guanine966-N2)-methyltransferase
MTMNSSKPPGAIRIIGGEWRSRQLRVPAVQDLRPTPDRVRETLFNWLQFALAGARCLDLFAGTGILGLEALSRGAAAVTAVELDPAATTQLRRHGAMLGAAALDVQQRDAMAWLEQGPAGAAYDLVFLDPPYASRLQERCCALLQERGWLAPGARVYLEAAESLDAIALPASWRLVRSKRAGDVHYGLCETSPAQPSL